jgi:alpha-glucosidase (family GH31 glycosyl hydrolase)
MMTLNTSDSCLELFVRTLQFGCFTTTFTIWGNIDEPNNLWDMPADVQDALRKALTFRAQMVPYSYTAARVAHGHDTAPVLSLAP